MYHYWNVISRQGFRGLHCCLPKYTKYWWRRRFREDYPSRWDIVRANSKSPLQRSLSAKYVSGTGQILTCRLRKDQQTEDDDEEDEDLDATEEKN